MWRKSRASSTSGADANCVEVALSAVARVRDSKNAAGPRLTIPVEHWRTFTEELRPPSGE